MLVLLYLLNCDYLKPWVFTLLLFFFWSSPSSYWQGVSEQLHGVYLPAGVIPRPVDTAEHWFGYHFCSTGKGVIGELVWNLTLGSKNYGQVWNRHFGSLHDQEIRHWKQNKFKIGQRTCFLDLLIGHFLLCVEVWEIRLDFRCLKAEMSESHY